jgi:hypothetical protein
MSIFGEPIDVDSLPPEEQYRFYREVLQMTDDKASLLVAFAAGVTTGDAPDPYRSVDDWLDAVGSSESWDGP